MSVKAKPPERTLRVISLGAGVQSSTVLLMACRGELGPIDAAIFADTGWEPAAVYGHLWWLAGEPAAAGLPLLIVSKGNIRDDALDPAHRFASIPVFVKSPGGGREGRARRQCTKEYKIEPIGQAIRRQLLGLAPGRAYLHRQLIPLDAVDFRSPEEKGQGALFDGEDYDGECDSGYCFT